MNTGALYDALDRLQLIRQRIPTQHSAYRELGVVIAEFSRALTDPGLVPSDEWESNWIRADHVLLDDYIEYGGEWRKITDMGNQIGGRTWLVLDGRKDLPLTLGNAMSVRVRRRVWGHARG